jgi:hypothetical protein
MPSTGAIPNRRLRMSGVSSKAPAMPMPTPLNVRATPFHTTRLRIALRDAPNAMRIPISRVPWLTRYASTP